MALDLDRFGRINERFGSAVGDLVLKAVAYRLTVAVGPGDYVGRVGGDEFAVLPSGPRTAAHLEAADRIAALLSQPIEIDGSAHLCAPVVGIAELVGGDDEPPRRLRPRTRPTAPYRGPLGSPAASSNRSMRPESEPCRGASQPRCPTGRCL